MLIVGTKVKSEHGIGTIKKIETYKNFKRYGVKHIDHPGHKPDGLLFLLKGELIDVKAHIVKCHNETDCPENCGPREHTLCEWPETCEVLNG